MDILNFALDQPRPVTVVLITGDGDFSYCAATLKERNHVIVTITDRRCMSSSWLGLSEVVLDANRIFSADSKESARSKVLFRAPEASMVSMSYSSDNFFLDCKHSALSISASTPDEIFRMTSSPIKRGRKRRHSPNSNLSESSDILKSPVHRPLKRAKILGYPMLVPENQIESKTELCTKLSSKEFSKKLSHPKEPFKFLDIVKEEARKLRRDGSATSVCRVGWIEIAQLLQICPEAYHDAGIFSKRRRFRTYMAFAARAGAIDVKGRIDSEPSEWWIEA